MARSVTHFPDWIAIGTVTNIAEIASINYDTSTITLKIAKTWTSGAKIWLYKKSDGVRVLYGASPDYGAQEYGQSDPSPTKPGDLDGNGKVDVVDLGIFLSNWGKTTKPPADLDQDGIVDVRDLGILLGNWGN